MHEEILIKFLQGVGRDYNDRYHADILQFTDDELEETHDYIQWLFPLCEPSRAVPKTLYIENVEVVKLLRADVRVQENMISALARMKQFYGDNEFWLQQGDHNHLRITRILKSLSLLVSKEIAIDFHNFIMKRVETVQPVTVESLEFWRKSVE